MRDDPNDNIIQSESFRLKTKITAKTPPDGTIKNIEVVGPLTYLSNFLGVFPMPSISFVKLVSFSIV